MWLALVLLFGATYPTGLTPADIRDGIAPGVTAGDCCWMGDRALINVTRPASADILLINIYLPPFAQEPGGQGITVRVGHAAPHEECCFDPGEHEIAIPLPAGHTGKIDVSLAARSTFVPRERGVNQDPRHLSVLVRGIAFMNSRTGERFDRAQHAWLDPRIAWTLLIIAGGVIGIATMRRPVLGAAALLLTDPFLIAAPLAGTTATLPKIALIAVAIALVPRLVRERAGGSRALTIILTANAVAVLVMLLASVHAVSHGDALRETLKALQYLATVAVAYAAFRLDPDTNVVRVALALLAFIVIVPAIAQERFGAPQNEMLWGHEIGRVAGLLEGPNQLAGFLGVVLPAIAAFASTKAGRMYERVLLALGALACLLTFSRGGIVSLGLVLLLVSWYRRRPAHSAALAIGTATLFIIASVPAFLTFGGARFAEALFATHDDRFNGGLGSRVDLWHAAFSMWRSHPAFGVGPGNFEIVVGRYDPGIRTHANGMFFQVLAEQGIAGLFAYLTVLLASTTAFLRNLQNPLALGACLASVALAFHQIVDCMTLYPKVGTEWSALLGIAAASIATMSAPGDVEAAKHV